MKWFVASILFVVSANAALLPKLYSIEYPSVSQFHSQDDLGQYSYGYNGGLSSKTETKTLDGVTRGSYSYVDANGILQTTQYTSDPINGFRAVATNLPRAPVDLNSIPAQVQDTDEVIQARAEHLSAYNRIAARPENAENFDIKPIQTRIASPIVTSLPPSTLLTSQPIITLGPGHGAYMYNYNAPGYTFVNGVAYPNLRPIVSPQQVIYTHQPQFFGAARTVDTVPTHQQLRFLQEQPKQVEDTVEVAAARAEHFSAVEEQKAKIRAAGGQ